MTRQSRSSAPPLCRFALVFALMVAVGSAQAPAPGRTSNVAPFDPATMAPPAALPQARFAPPDRTVIPLEELDRRRALLPPRSTRAGTPPAIQTSDPLAAGRAPETIARQPLALTPSTSFEGLPNSANLNPADTDIAAGPEDLMLVVNGSVARYTKAGLQTNAMTMSQWFSNLHATVCSSGSELCRFAHASVRYDSLHGRFLLLAFSENLFNRRTHFVLSVSNGATFAGGWRNWSLEANLNGLSQTAFEVDFPQLGYDNNAVYLTGNMFNSLGNFIYAKLRILKKPELYNPATTALTWRDFWDLRNEDTTVVASLRPAQQRGKPGTGTPPAILVNSAFTPSADYISIWRVENPITETPTITRTTIRGFWPYDLPAVFAQSGTSVTIDSGDTRILKAIVRDGILHTARNTGYSGEPTTVTFDRIDVANNRLALQARLTSGNFFFPAFDLPASLGPVNALPNKLITGTTTDAAGLLTFPGIADVKPGEDRFEVVTNGRVRWGSYSGGAVDPVQGGLWVYGHYAKPRGATLGQWGSWASYFPWRTSPQFSDVGSSSPFGDFINVMKLWSITGGCTATQYCPGTNVTRGQMAVFVIRAMLGDSFTFPAQPFFSDVPATHPFFSFIQKMRELGITTGCSATTYCPDANVTRAEMAVFLVRGKLTSLHADNFPFPAAAYFTDAPASHPFFKFIQKMRELGITSGCTASTYCADAPVTREQMAVFVVRSFLN